MCALNIYPICARPAKRARACELKKKKKKIQFRIEKYVRMIIMCVQVVDRSRSVVSENNRWSSFLQQSAVDDMLPRTALVWASIFAQLMPINYGKRLALPTAIISNFSFFSKKVCFCFEKHDTLTFRWGVAVMDVWEIILIGPSQKKEVNPPPQLSLTRDALH